MKTSRLIPTKKMKFGIQTRFNSGAPAPPTWVEMEVNNKKVRVLPGSTILQACTQVGIDVPRFCYHDKLSIAGNCRMCLVEVAKTPKPVASCAMPVVPGMKVKGTSR
jgi:NADH dehydrogenase (ubiquinone) Fe-S protein 1